MKSIASVCFLVVSFQYLSAQETPQKKNAIALELYQPIQIVTSTAYYNDNTIFAPTGITDVISRRYFSNAIGLSYEREIKPGLILRPRFGITIRKLDEKYESYFDDGVSNSIVESSYSYKQKHINSFIGLSKRISVTKQFTLGLGLEAMSVIYLSTVDHFTSFSTQTSVLYYPDTVWTAETLSSSGGTNYGNMFILGIGPSIKPEFCFSNNLFVSAELQIYFAFSKINDQLVSNFNGDPTLYTGPIITTADIDIQQWGWTKMSPLIRVGYKF